MTPQYELRNYIGDDGLVLFQIRTDNPTLNRGGFGLAPGSHRLSATDQENLLRFERGFISGPIAVAEFTRARPWLRPFRKQRDLNTTGTTADLARRAGVLHGLLICAAMAERYWLQRHYGRQHCWINITSGALQ